MDARSLRLRLSMPVPAPRPEGHRTLLKLGVIAAAGVLLGLALVVPRGNDATAGARLRLYGELLPEGPEGADVAVARAERQLTGWFNLELPDGGQRRVAPDELGVALDRARLRRMIRDTASGGGRTGTSAAGSEPVDLVVPVLLDRRRAMAALLASKEALDQAALDARLDLDSRAVVPERFGRRLDVDGSLAALEAALERGAATAPLVFETERPRRSARELADVRHDVLLGCFEAPLARSARARDRDFNLALAASKLDGLVLMPDAVFDFNAAVGPRDEARGYRVAALVGAGEPVDGTGSSISQISGALHAAALFAGLDVVERHLPARPSAIDLGLDAAVTYPVASLRLKNTHSFPIVLRVIAREEKVRAEVRGRERPELISLLIQIDGMTPFDVIEAEDATLQRGTRVVAQRGVPGIDLHRYRIRRSGAHAVREVLREHYPSTPRIIHVGARSASSGASSAGTHAFASLVASTTGRPPRDPTTNAELVIASQGDDPCRPPVQRRVKGRFGVSEWSKDIGEPAWDGEP